MEPESLAAMASSALIGVVMLGTGLYRRARMAASQGWSQFEGKIVHSGIEADTGADSNGYTVVVSYHYVVNGTTHTGSRVGFSSRYYVRKRKAEAVAAKYPVDARLPVYVDPARPDDAVLERHYPDTLLLCVGGVVMLLLAMLVALYPAKG